MHPIPPQPPTQGTATGTPPAAPGSDPIGELIASELGTDNNKHKCITPTPLILRQRPVPSERFPAPEAQHKLNQTVIQQDGDVRGDQSMHVHVPGRQGYPSTMGYGTIEGRNITVSQPGVYGEETAKSQKVWNAVDILQRNAEIVNHEQSIMKHASNLYESHGDFSKPRFLDVNVGAYAAIVACTEVNAWAGEMATRAVRTALRACSSQSWVNDAHIMEAAVRACAHIDPRAGGAAQHAGKEAILMDKMSKKRRHGHRVFVYNIVPGNRPT
eukprot:GFYU01043556.1.p1 GENE.GFYU01043556.1~~GFYU01043556.1.p1  ORF type:complete len:271 (+),score=44.60 GFYU01043556.1:3-815(+)